MTDNCLFVLAKNGSTAGSILNHSEGTRQVIFILFMPTLQETATEFVEFSVLI